MGGPGGTHGDPKISGLVNGKTHGLTGTHHFVASNRHRNRPRCFWISSSRVFCCFSSAAFFAFSWSTWRDQDQINPQKAKGKYIHRQMLKKNDQPIFNCSQLSMLFFKVILGFFASGTSLAESSAGGGAVSVSKNFLNDATRPQPSWKSKLGVQTNTMAQPKCIY